MRVLEHDTGNLLRAVVRAQTDACGTLQEPAQCQRSGTGEEAIEGARQHGILPMLFSELSAIEGAIPPDMPWNSPETNSNAMHFTASQTRRNCLRF